jgi:hypothetical protein
MRKEDASPNHLLFLPCMYFTIVLGQAACCGFIQLLLANPKTFVGAIPVELHSVCVVGINSFCLLHRVEFFL